MVKTNDVVIVHVENKPAFYARIEAVSPDEKPGWWQVRLLVFTFPLQIFTWILDEYQLDGADFTMGGTPIRMEPVVSPATEQEQLPTQDQAGEPLEPQQQSGGSKVVSLADRRKK